VSPSLVVAANFPGKFWDHLTELNIFFVGNSRTTSPVLKFVTIVLASLAEETTRLGSFKHQETERIPA
jgi:hypothetical protein